MNNTIAEAIEVNEYACLDACEDILIVINLKELKYELLPLFAFDKEKHLAITEIIAYDADSFLDYENDFIVEWLNENNLEQEELSEDNEENYENQYNAWTKSEYYQKEWIPELERSIKELIEDNIILSKEEQEEKINLLIKPTLKTPTR